MGGLPVSEFTVFPAIDLRGGRCVRLVQGDFERSKEYDADPVARACEWERRGARALHVVDLDGARSGEPSQLKTLSGICAAVEIPVQAGGGVRSVEALDAFLEAGVWRVIVGTAALDDRVLSEALKAAGEALVVAVDARDGVVATHGWMASSGVGVLDLARRLAGVGVQQVLYTDVGRDGMGGGAALESTAEVASIIPTIASGGVRGTKDVAELSRIHGVRGVVVGTALYEGSVGLEELLELQR